jgi:hypothetical protein
VNLKFVFRLLRAHHKQGWPTGATLLAIVLTYVVKYFDKSLASNVVHPIRDPEFWASKPNLDNDC